MNQIGAIACLLAGSLWAVVAIVTIFLTESQVASSLMLFATLEIIDWIGIPLYVKRIRWSYIMIIIVWIICLVGLVALPGTPPWYTFSYPVFHFLITIFYLVSLAGIYFSYKSYRESARASELAKQYLPAVFDCLENILYSAYKELWGVH